MNPFVGHWIANLEKSRRHTNHQFQSATLTFDVTGSDVSLTHAGTNMAGKEESGTTVLHADGVERPASPHAPGVLAVRGGSARTCSPPKASRTDESSAKQRMPCRTTHGR